MRGSEKEREKERVLGDWNDDEKEEEEEGLFVDEDNDREEEGLFVGCVNWKGCVICFLFESFSISIPRFASFSILSPFSNPFTSFGLCIGFNVPNRTDEHPNRKEIARIGEPSSMDSWLQYAAPDP